MQKGVDALEGVPPKHQKEQAALLAGYKEAYQRWHFRLRMGFGLLMYGFGSKKALLEDFASSTLLDGSVVVVNGYLPTVKLKNVLFTIANLIWELGSGGSSKRKKLNTGVNSGKPMPGQSMDDLLLLIQEKAGSHVVYLLVHNIDGPGVRDEDTQRALALAAACPCIRMVASIDHINAPLLWNKLMVETQFNWWWHHTPTYAHYSVEGVHVPILLTAGGSLQTIRSASLVLKSLTPNAQSVFKTLAEFQLSHPQDQGLPLRQLYSTCRDKFLVSSELTLRAHITEFKDHELVRWRRGSDGQDCLFIPMSVDALTKLLNDVFK